MAFQKQAPLSLDDLGTLHPHTRNVVQASFIEEIGPWPEECITSEDWAYLWRMALREPYPAHTNKCYFIYRIHEAQSTGSNLDDQKRDKEKFQILHEIYQHDVKHGNFTLWQKALFRNKFYQIARVTKDPAFRKELLQAAGPGQSLIWQYYRTKMKIGRVKTKSDWQPMHGVEKSKEHSSKNMEQQNIKDTDIIFLTPIVGSIWLFYQQYLIKKLFPNSSVY